MANPLKNTNALMGSLLVLGIVMATIFSKTEPSGLAAFGAFFITLCVLIAWPIIKFIESRAVKKASVAPTKDQLKKY